jgi:hypothetical protein
MDRRLVDFLSDLFVLDWEWHSDGLRSVTGVSVYGNNWRAILIVTQSDGSKTRLQSKSFKEEEEVGGHIVYSR